MNPVRTTCPYCGVGCGIIAQSQPDGSVAIAGDPDHPANAGRLCSKGAALAETLSLEGRLLHPLVHGERTSWNTALALVAQRFSDTIRAHGPDSVAFYVSGQCLTEDYYVANKLMKGFIGSANIDTNSRLCMASSVAGHKRAFGADTVPGTYADLEEADLVVLVGSNLAWCHPVLFQRLMAARERRGTRLVVIDPRRTATAELADLHLAITPDEDLALFNGLLAHLAAGPAVDAEFVALHTSGAAEALLATGRPAIEAVVERTGIPAEQLREFYALVAATERTVTVYSQGVNQSVSGTDKVNAILNCHLLTGRIGRPGMGPFSVTGQPNAMGGREVGGLANQLAARMDFGDPRARDRVRRFWNAPHLAERPGLKAVDLFEAVTQGRVKALWIMATNPADSVPDAHRVEVALQACPFVVVSDMSTETDTVRHAHVALPSTAWAEKAGTVTNSERRISRQRAFLPAPGEARPDWWQMAEVARRMGFADAFAYGGPADIFCEHAALSAFENDGTRDFDIGSLSDLDAAGYETLAPVQWPIAKGQASAERRFFEDGRFFHPDGKARLLPTPLAAPKVREPGLMTLNTGRVRDHWHTMTRTGKSPRLSAHVAEPFAELHPLDAERLAIHPATLVEIRTTRGRLVVRARISEAQRPGSVFVPMHWTDQFASAARVDGLVAPLVDPRSGQPGLKATEAAVRPFKAAWHGFAVLVSRPATIPSDYWALARAEAGWRLELAGAGRQDFRALAATLFMRDRGEPELLSYHDERTGQHRFAAFDGPRLSGAFFVAPEPVAVARSFASESLARIFRAPSDRLRVLAGRPGSAAEDQGATICSCFHVGANAIMSAISSGDCATVADIGAMLRAGTNCGSCRPEIKRIIDSHKRAGPRLNRSAAENPLKMLASAVRRRITQERDVHPEVALSNGDAGSAP